jgi:hypothetical protein
VNRPWKAGVTIGALTLLALALRLWGLRYGIPHPVVRPDEELLVGKALLLSLGRIWDPGDYRYPHAMYNLDALALAAFRGAGQLLGAYRSNEDFLVDIAIRRPGLHYVVCRSVTAVLGALTVPATALAAWHGYRRNAVALGAALLVAANFLHARDSHFATVDVPMTFFATLSLAFSLKAAGTQSRRDFGLAGLFAGLATSVKYNAGVVIFSTVVAAAPRLFRGAEPRARRQALFSLVLAGVLMAAAFAVTAPYCVLRPRNVVAALFLEKRLLFDHPGVAAWRVHLPTTLPGAFGWPGIAAAALGLGRAIWRRRPADLILLAFLLPASMSMARVTWVVPRYVLPLVPPLAILAVEAVLALRPLGRPAWALAVSVVLAAPPFQSTIAYDRLASREDTRLLASRWVAENLERRSRILVCRGYGAPVINDDPRRPPAFKPRIVPCTIEAIRDAGIPYLVTADHPFIAFFRMRRDVKEWLDAEARPLVVFDPFRPGTGIRPYFYEEDSFYLPWSGLDAVERGGPIITIWELGPATRPPS